MKVNLVSKNQSFRRDLSKINIHASKFPAKGVYIARANKCLPAAASGSLKIPWIFSSSVYIPIFYKTSPNSRHISTSPSTYLSAPSFNAASFPARRHWLLATCTLSAAAAAIPNRLESGGGWAVETLANAEIWRCKSYTRVCTTRMLEARIVLWWWWC